MSPKDTANATTANHRSSAGSRWLRDHGRAIFGSLGELTRRSGSTAMTALVIGLTLALPMALYVATQNLSRMVYGWEGAVQASLFLKLDVDDDQGAEFAAKVGKMPGVASVQYISRSDAMVEFSKTSGYGDALKALGENPLPAVVVVSPDTTQSPQEIQALINRLSQLPEVDQARLDQQWLRRLQAILHVATAAVALLAVLLAAAGVVIIGNTLRLDIEGHREEIIVMKWIGASAGFVQRPFLWAGFWYGFLGAFVALAMIGILIGLLSEPTANLAGLYDSSFELEGPTLNAILVLLLAGILLGAGSAWFAVRRHIALIEPS